MSLARSVELRLVAREVARELRKKQTPVEVTLWEALRNRKLLGKKFLRQHPILVEFCDKATFFVADFYCAEARLIIEVDGKIHAHQVERDKLRDQVLDSVGYRVLRVTNEEVDRDLAAVLQSIARAMSSPPHSPLPKITSVSEPR